MSGYAPRNRVEQRIIEIQKEFDLHMVGTISYHWGWEEEKRWEVSAYHEGYTEDVGGYGRTLEEALDNLIIELRTGPEE